MPTPSHEPHVLSAQLGRQARAARQARGLSIREAARQLACSPRFVLELEQGKPTARMDKVLQLMAGLGLELSVDSIDDKSPPAEDIIARVEARANQTLRDEKLARAHDRIAAKLALGAIGAVEIGRARAQIRKWREAKLCSRWYVDSWTALLDGTGPQVAAKMLALGGEDARALFQNTPFGFLVREHLRA